MSVFQRLDSHDVRNPEFDQTFAEIVGHEKQEPSETVRSTTEMFITVESQSFQPIVAPEVVPEPIQEVFEPQPVEEIITEIIEQIKEPDVEPQPIEEIQEIISETVEKVQEPEIVEKKEKAPKKKRDKSKKTKSTDSDEAPAHDPMSVFQRLDSHDVRNPEFDQTFAEIVGHEEQKPSETVRSTTEMFITVESQSFQQAVAPKVVPEPIQEIVEPQPVEEIITEIVEKIKEPEVEPQPIEEILEIISETVEKVQEPEIVEKKEKAPKKKRDKSKKTKSTDSDEAPVHDPMSVFQRLDSHDVRNPEFDQTFAEIVGHEKQEPSETVRSTTEMFITVESQSFQPIVAPEVVPEPIQEVFEPQPVEEIITEIVEKIKEPEVKPQPIEEIQEIISETVEKVQEPEIVEKKEKAPKKKRDKSKKTKSTDSDEAPAHDPMSVFQRLDSHDVRNPEFDQTFTEIVGHEEQKPSETVRSTTEMFITVESQSFQQIVEPEVVPEPIQEVFEPQPVEEIITEIVEKIKEPEVEPQPIEEIQEIISETVEKVQEPEIVEKKEKAPKKKRDKSKKTKSTDSDEAPVHDPMSVFQRLDSHDVRNPEFDQTFAEIVGHEKREPSETVRSTTEMFITVESQSFQQAVAPEVVPEPIQEIVEPQPVEEIITEIVETIKEPEVEPQPIEEIQEIISETVEKVQEPEIVEKKEL